MNRPLFIRADATTQIGTGHVMRCIALGQAWQDRGGKVTFLSHCGSQPLMDRIAREGFELISLEHAHPHSEDLAVVLQMISERQDPALRLQNWLCLDGYHFTPDYQKAIRNSGIRLLVVDDMNHLPRYEADILFNQNIQAPDIDYNCDPDCVLLLGTQYAMLRREFLKYREMNREAAETAKNILVTLGGSDSDNVTLKVIESIKMLKSKALNVKIVVGPANPHLLKIKNATESAPFPMYCCQNADQMPELMAWADIAISGGGSTCWELAFMGVPSLIMILAENQTRIAEGLEKRCVAHNLGHFNNNTVESISQALKDLLWDTDKRKKMSHTGRRFVDGSGASRVVDQMEAKE